VARTVSAGAPADELTDEFEACRRLMLTTVQHEQGTTCPQEREQLRAIVAGAHIDDAQRPQHGRDDSRPGRERGKIHPPRALESQLGGVLEHLRGQAGLPPPRRSR